MLENEGVALRAIRWSEIFPWLSLFKSFRIAVYLRLMTLGAVAALLILLGWWAIAAVFSHDGALNSSWSGPFGEQSAWQVINHSVPNRPLPSLNPSLPKKENLADHDHDHAYMVPDMLPAPGMSGLDIGAWSPLVHTWGLLTQPVWRILSIQPPTAGESLTIRDFFSLLFSAFWSLAVWACFGAAISRVAAVQLATGEQVGWIAAMRWAGTKWLAYFSAPALPMIGVGLVVLPILVMGLLMKTGFFALVVALIWPLVLAAGLVMSVLLLGVLLGWPLMWATISVEGTDSFDALNRTYAYVFQRPLRYLSYTIVAAILGWLGWILVENFAAAVIWLASWAASWGAGSARIEELTGTATTSLSQAAASVIAFWCGWVKLLAIGYSFSYFSVASTAIYYLLRRDVDARETDEVFVDADASEQKFGLPVIENDEAGAPEVAEKTASPEQSQPPEKPAVPETALAEKANEVSPAPVPAPDSAPVPTPLPAVNSADGKPPETAAP